MADTLMGIYEIKNIKNNRCYIGSAVDLMARKHLHYYQLRRDKHCNRHLQRSWSKYGEGSFKFSVIEVVNDRNMLIEREQFWFDSQNPEFNICKVAGSSLGCTYSEETKKKLSIANKGNQKWLGRKHSEETKKKIGEKNRGSKARVGKPHSEETKEKIREARKGTKHTRESKIKIGEGRRGRKHSAEAKKKISVANSGLKRSDEAIKKMSESKMGINCGEKHHNVKLTERDVVEIIILIDEGILSHREIGEKYGVVKQVVTAIGKGKSWKHIDREKALNKTLQAV